MKKFLNAVIILALVITAAYFAFRYFEEKALKEEQIKKRRQELAELRRQESEKAKEIEVEEKKRQEQIIRDRQQRNLIADSRNASGALAVPKPSRISSAAPDKAAVSSKRSIIADACRKHRCRLVKYEDKPDGSFITVQGPDQNGITDMLNTLRDKGMRDFKYHADLSHVGWSDGTNVFTAVYTIKW